MRRLSLAVLLLTLVAGCDSAPSLLTVDVSTLSHDPAALVGTWELTSVTGYADGRQHTWTPEESGVAGSLTFRADGMAVSDRGGEPRTVPYEVRREAYPNGGQSEVPYLYLDGRPEAFGIDGDRLYIDARPVDGTLDEYRRR